MTKMQVASSKDDRTFTMNAKFVHIFSIRYGIYHYETIMVLEPYIMKVILLSGHLSHNLKYKRDRDNAKC